MLNALFTVIVLLAIFATVAASQPADFTITRAATMNAPAAAVFEQVNDFHKWNAWSPWAKMDPNAQNTFEGPASGKGAILRWSGNNKVGAGNMTITESRPSDLILMRLEFLKPFAAVNTTEFTFTPEGNGTRVTWTMTGTNGFIGKAIGLIFNCQKMVGGQFDQGLANIKAIVEAGK